MTDAVRLTGPIAGTGFECNPRAQMFSTITLQANGVTETVRFRAAGATAQRIASAIRQQSSWGAAVEVGSLRLIPPPPPRVVMGPITFLDVEVTYLGPSV